MNDKQINSKIYEVIYERSHDFLSRDFLSEDSVWLDRNQFIKWDKLIEGDVVLTWNRTQKKYEKGYLKDAYEVASSSDVKRKDNKRPIKLYLSREDHSSVVKE